MSTIEIQFPTEFHSLLEIQEQLNESLDRHLPESLVHKRWNHDVLELTGPGIDGSIQVVEGHLRGRVDLRLPASMFREQIETKMRYFLEKIANHHP